MEVSAVLERISAASNEKIKYAAALASSASKRRENGEFLLEGARICADAAENGVAVVRAFFTGEALGSYSSYISKIEAVCRECYEISPQAARKLSSTDSTQGVFCVCRAGVSSFSLKPGGVYLALENIQDPSNIGAICRSAEAVGIDGLIISGGCDIHNPKALRAAMGSSLRIPIMTTDSLISYIREAEGFTSLACVPAADAGDIREISREFPRGGIICCIGNEGNGLTHELITACDRRVTIPMKGKAESLNASAAAAIIAWELKR